CAIGRSHLLPHRPDRSAICGSVASGGGPARGRSCERPRNVLTTTRPSPHRRHDHPAQWLARSLSAEFWSRAPGESLTRADAEDLSLALLAGCGYDCGERENSHGSERHGASIAHRPGKNRFDVNYRTGYQDAALIRKP